jgi:hypothetical protein
MSSIFWLTNSALVYEPKFAGKGGVAGGNGNASETKANESFDNSVFFDIEAKRTSSLESKLFSKRSEHIR